MSYKQLKENGNTTRIKTRKLHCYLICFTQQILPAKHLSLRNAFFLQPLSFTIIFKLSMPGPSGAIRATESYLEAERNIIHLISLWRDTCTRRGEERGNREVADRNNGKGKDRARQSFVQHTRLFCLQFRDHPATRPYHTSLTLLYQFLNSSFFNFLLFVFFFFFFSVYIMLKKVLRHF